MGFNLDENGRPVRRIWTPGEKRVEVVGSIPPGIQVGPVPNGSEIEAAPRLKLVSTHEFVGLLVELGPVTIPFPLTPDQADEMADKIKAEASKVRALQCPAASPATSPSDSPAQPGIVTTIAMPETPMPNGSITVTPGFDSGDSSSASTHSVSDASSESC